jgi:hypothetical protein
MVSRIEPIILAWDRIRRLELGVAGENEVIVMAMVNQVESQGLPNAINILVGAGGGDVLECGILTDVTPSLDLSSSEPRDRHLYYSHVMPH